MARSVGQSARRACVVALLTHYIIITSGCLNRAAVRHTHLQQAVPVFTVSHITVKLSVIVKQGYSTRYSQQYCSNEEVLNSESLMGTDPQFSGFASQKHTPDTGGECHGNEWLLRCKAGNRDCNLRGVMGFHLQQCLFIKMLSSLRRH